MSEQSYRADTPETIEYRDIPGFSGYRVGIDGTVWTCKKRNGHGLTNQWKKLRTRMIRRYVSVGLNSDVRKKFTKQVHVLVLEAFVSPRPSGLLALHKDDDRSNNNLSNLYWGTPKQNSADCKMNGHKNPQHGSARYNAKITEEDVVEMRRLKDAGMTYPEIARRFNVCDDTAWKACLGHNWKHVLGKTSTRRTEKTCCKRGHPYLPGNLRISSEGRRMCIICVRMASRKSYRLRNQASPERYRVQD